MTTTHTTHGTRAVDRQSPVRTITAIVAGTFLVVGVAGFIPGITQDLGDIEFAGHESGAELLGIFQVSVLHNLVHVAFGVAGLIALARPVIARLYLLIGGAVYLVLWLYGLLVDKASDANFVPLDQADNWLHLALGLGMIGLGLLIPRDRTERVDEGLGTNRA
jgi:hypothetical protein